MWGEASATGVKLQKVLLWFKLFRRERLTWTGLLMGGTRWMWVMSEAEGHGWVRGGVLERYQLMALLMRGTVDKEMVPLLSSPPYLRKYPEDDGNHLVSVIQSFSWAHSSCPAFGSDQPETTRQSVGLETLSSWKGNARTSWCLSVSYQAKITDRTLDLH